MVIKLLFNSFNGIKKLVRIAIKDAGIKPNMISSVTFSIFNFSDLIIKNPRKKYINVDMKDDKYKLIIL